MPGVSRSATRRIKSSLKIKYGLVTKAVVLGVFALYALIVGSVSTFGSFAGQQHSTQINLKQQLEFESHHGRQLSNSSVTNSSTSTSSPSSKCSFDDMGEGTYPKHLLTCEQMKQGAIILPILGCAFMFMGLAIVCDDFFVPALETISWRLDLTDDVAGK